MDCTRIPCNRRWITRERSRRWVARRHLTSTSGWEMDGTIRHAQKWTGRKDLTIGDGWQEAPQVGDGWHDKACTKMDGKGTPQDRRWMAREQLEIGTRWYDKAAPHDKTRCVQGRLKAKQWAQKLSNWSNNEKTPDSFWLDFSCVCVCVVCACMTTVYLCVRRSQSAAPSPTAAVRKRL